MPQGSSWWSLSSNGPETIGKSSRGCVGVRQVTGMGMHLFGLLLRANGPKQRCGKVIAGFWESEEAQFCCVWLMTVKIDSSLLCSCAIKTAS